MFQQKHSRVRVRRGEQNHSLWRHIALGVGVCLSVALILIGVWYCTRTAPVTIAYVAISGGETIDHDVVRDTIESVLGGSYFSIIPHRFSMLYPHDAIVAAVSAIPRVKDVAVSRGDERTLEVTFSEYMPYALWCVSSDEVSCYFLDETGYAFAPGPKLDGGTLVRHFFEEGDELGKKQVFEIEVLQRMHAFLDRLIHELALRVTDVYYTHDGDIKLMIHGGGEILIRNDGLYEATFDNLVSVLASKEFKHLEPGNFQYIDLRFGNKVFVNEEEPIAPTTTEAIATTT